MKRRRAIIVFVVGTIILTLLGGAMPRLIEESLPAKESLQSGAQASNLDGDHMAQSALADLEMLAVKGRAPKTGYERVHFGEGWASVNGCSTRNIILYRDLQEPVLDGECIVVSGTLADPYTGEIIIFSKQKSTEVQIDHVVALSDAWQKGAQLLSAERREQLANDPLELLAVSGSQNQAKGDGDAATWLPKNKAFRCEYVARQIAIKKKYELWVTQPEKQAMLSVLKTCVN